jgi:hypothetical protein
MVVADHLTAAPIAVNPFDTLAEARALMEAGGFRHLIVTDNTGLTGVLTEGDIRRHEGYLERTKVTAAMTWNPVVCATGYFSARSGGFVNRKEDQGPASGRQWQSGGHRDDDGLAESDAAANRRSTAIIRVFDSTVEVASADLPICSAQ